MKIAIVGCGYVADLYMITLPNHPELELVGVFDRSSDALDRFFAHHQTSATRYETLEDMLDQSGAGLILNLTNPRSHYEVSRAAIDRGLHVYSEKPMGMTLEEGEDLLRRAKDKGVEISAAPCSVLGSAAQTILKKIRSGEIGRPVLAYAEMEDGMVFHHDWREWLGVSGAPWPGEDEFEIGCTLEHAGYYLTWLCAIFGPAVEVVAFAAKLFPDKGTDTPPEGVANDYSVTNLRFADGAVARLTCGLVAPLNRSLHIQGDKGILSVTDAWNYSADVFLRPVDGEFGMGPRLGQKVVKKVTKDWPLRQWAGRNVGVKDEARHLPEGTSRMDFMRGPAVMARAIRENKPLPLPAEFAMHITEIALVAQNPDRFPSPYRPRYTYDQIEPIGE